MTNPSILIATLIVSALIFIFFVVTGIIRESILRIMASLLFLCIAVGSFFFLGVYAASKASSKVTQTIDYVKQKFEPRNGTEIYFALFGKPIDNCSKVTNQKDQTVPRLDCCIWLEFQTCQKELNRIIKQQSFKATRFLSEDTTSYLPNYSPKPDWWTPQFLGDSVIVLREFNFDKPNRDKILIFAKDSSHAFYCDMAGFVV